MNPIFNLRTLAVLLVFGFYVSLNTSCRNTNNKNAQTSNQLEKGPEWIINSLSESGVFDTPDFTFTKKYDEFKKYQNIKGLFFDGLVYHKKPTKVFCWYGIPESLQKGEKAPAVVLVHGGGGTAFPDWVKKWTDKGYIAIAPALEGQVPGPEDKDSNGIMKHPTWEFSGPYRQGFFLDIKTEKLKDQWFYHAVADIVLSSSLLRSFTEVDTTKIGITGISWGGILTNVVTGVDNRFDFSIPVYGCGYLDETPVYYNQLKLLTPESKLFYMNNWEPSLYIPLHNQPTLFINGTNDLHFTMNSFIKTYNASICEKYLHIEYEMKHGHSAGWSPEVIYQFADYYTRNGSKPLLLNYTKNKKVIDYKGELNKAFFYYTVDTADWGAENYKWIRSEAKIESSNNTIKIDIPEKAVCYFVNGVAENGTYSTPMIKVNK